MFLPPSVQKEYALVFSGDPALALPSDEKERDNALRVARETGDWSGLIKPGQLPTLFTVRPLSGSMITWLGSQRSRNRLSGQEACELAFRLGLRKIDNFGDFEIEFEREGAQVLAAVTVLDALYDIGRVIGKPNLGRELIAELGGLVIERATESISPK